MLVKASAEYNKRDAEKFWGLSAAAYCGGRKGFNSDLLVSWKCGYACDKVSLVPGSVAPFGRAGVPSAHGIVGKYAPAEDAKCVVAFKGTGNVGDMLTDLASLVAVELDGCAGCKVGRGLRNTYDAIKGDIQQHLRKLGCKSVAVTGHSLGAGQAALAMFDLQRDFHLEPSYTFGQPVIGNRAFQKALSSAASSLYRIVNGTDPVPHSGPADNAEGLYTHHQGAEVFFQGKVTDGHVECAEKDELAGCSYSYFKERTGLDVKTITTAAGEIARLGPVAARNVDYHMHYLDEAIAGQDAQKNCIVEELGGTMYP